MESPEYAAIRAARGYAGGGSFPGGWGVFGEEGPELRYAGPSLVYSNGQSRSLLNLDPVILELRRLRSEVQVGNVQVARNTWKTSRLLDKFDVEGLGDRVA